MPASQGSLEAGRIYATLIAVALLGVTMMAGCQDSSGSRGFGKPFHARIVYPDGESFDSSFVRQVTAILQELRTTPGLGRGTAPNDSVTISFAIESREGIDATSVPRDRLIILPLGTATQWKPMKLRRVLQHELAHVRMATYLEQIAVPAWLREGFAEWAAGGIKCEGEMRIHLDLIWRKLHYRTLPHLDDPNVTGGSRLRYDYYATFLEYLDERSQGGVTNGRLLESLKENGVDLGLRQFVQTTVEEVTKEWHTYLLQRYRELAEDFSCEPDF